MLPNVLGISEVPKRTGNLDEARAKSDMHLLGVGDGLEAKRRVTERRTHLYTSNATDDSCSLNFCKADKNFLNKMSAFLCHSAGDEAVKVIPSLFSTSAASLSDGGWYGAILFRSVTMSRNKFNTIFKSLLYLLLSTNKASRSFNPLQLSS